MSVQKLDSSQLFGFQITDLETATAEEVSSGITLPVIVSNGSAFRYKVVAAKTWSDYVVTTTSEAISKWNDQVSTAVNAANTATKNANDATALAHTATTAANNASSDAQTAESQRADAEKQRVAAEQQRAATFQKLADGNAATITEMQRIAASISNAQGAVSMSSVPASICVEADFTAVAGGTVNVSPVFFAPRGCNGSVMYHVVSGNATAHLNGDVTLPSDAGDVCVEVIPALNNMAGKVVTIHVTAPTPLLDLLGEEITDEKGETITV